MVNKSGLKPDVRDREPGIAGVNKIDEPHHWRPKYKEGKNFNRNGVNGPGRFSSKKLTGRFLNAAGHYEKAPFIFS
jgi:hypothetical protein